MRKTETSRLSKVWEAVPILTICKGVHGTAGRAVQLLYESQSMPRRKSSASSSRDQASRVGESLGEEDIIWKLNQSPAGSLLKARARSLWALTYLELVSWRSLCANQIL